MPLTAASMASGGGSLVLKPVAQVQPERYEEQLQLKVEMLRDLFASHQLQLPDLELHRSVPVHYRMRAEFQVWHDKDDSYYVMFDTPAAGSGAEAADKSAVGSDPAELATASDRAAQAATHDAANAADGGNTARSDGKRSRAERGRAPLPRRAPRTRVRVDEFPVGSLLLNALMSAVRQHFLGCETLRQRLHQVNFHTTLSGQAMVTLVYHRQLGDDWLAAAAEMRANLLAALGDQCSVLHVIGRSRKQKVEIDASFVEEVLTVNGRELRYKQVEGAFSQPNAGMCQQMLAWAQSVTAPSSGTPPAARASATPPAEPSDHPEPNAGGGAAGADTGTGTGSTSDLLELYCGNGNFTVAIAGNVRRVVATEVSKSSVEAARHNLDVNGVTNAFLARMSSEEFTEAWRGRQVGRRRLAGLGDWQELALETLLVDPPRAGLDADTLALLSEFRRVLYVSCNPETLAANLAAVRGTHAIRRFAVFDQFPYTHHLECGAYLVRDEDAWQKQQHEQQQPQQAQPPQQHEQPQQGQQQEQQQEAAKQEQQQVATAAAEPQGT